MFIKLVKNTDVDKMNTKSQGAFMIGLGFLIFFFICIASYADEEFGQSDAAVVWVVAGLSLIILGAVVRLKGIREEEKKASSKESAEENPLKILKLKLAKGEITKKEFREMKKALEE